MSAAAPSLTVADRNSDANSDIPMLQKTDEHVIQVVAQQQDQFTLTTADLRRIVNFDQRNDAAHLRTLWDTSSPNCLTDICARLCTDAQRGLSTRQFTEGGGARTVTHVEARQAQYGRNVIAPPPSLTVAQLVINTIKEDPIIKTLLVAALVTLIIQTALHPADGWVDGTAIVIAVIIVLSVTAGNDYHKERKFRQLLLLQSDKRVRVLRDGSSDLISSWQLLVGDVVELLPGDEVPGDGVFLRGNRLVIDESPLTGESLPIKKSETAPLLFSGTQVSEGSAYMLITAVGERSSAGEIQAMLSQSMSEETSLQKKLSGVAVLIGKLGMSAGVLTLLGLLVRWAVDVASSGTAVTLDTVPQLIGFFIVGITVVVVAVPEGLPLAVTISLAFSMFKMMKDRCFVRHLRASETMGEATCICTDKTGTLTENAMTVVKLMAGGAVHNGAGSGHSLAAPFSQDPLANSALTALLAEAISCNSTCFLKANPKGGQEIFVGSATEGAMLVLARKMGADYQRYRELCPAVENGQLGFSSARKRMTTTVRPADAGSLYRIHTKGASEIVLQLCTRELDSAAVTQMSQERRLALETLIREWASDGLRTIILAYRDTDEPPAVDENGEPIGLEADLTLLALVGIKDPVRAEVPRAVAMCKRAGLTVRMVTGDNVLTACTIARECGIMYGDGVAIEGPAFRAMSEQEKIELVPRLQVMARSSPADKHTLVSLLKKMGEVVAVTGDGTNDAPALKEADVGFAMGLSGTQIALNASDIVLMDDNFASIVQAIKWGRNVLEVIRKFLQFQLAINASAIIITLLGSVSSAHARAPLSTVQLLWINLIMDSLGALALASEEPEEKILLTPPQRKTDRLITRNMWQFIGAVAVYEVVMCMWLLLGGYEQFGVAAADEDRIHTLVFTTFVLMQVVNEVIARQLERQANIVEGLTRNHIFVTIMFVIVAVQVLAVQLFGSFMNTVALSAAEWAWCALVAACLAPFVIACRLLTRFRDAHNLNQIKPVELPYSKVPEKEKSASAGQQRSGNDAVLKTVALQ